MGGETFAISRISCLTLIGDAAYRNLKQRAFRDGCAEHCLPTGAKIKAYWWRDDNGKPSGPMPVYISGYHYACEDTAPYRHLALAA